MALIAGIDIGNSTTEIVVCNGTNPVAWDRRPTRGIKGSAASLQAAAALLKNIERVHQITVDQVAVAPWKPVLTQATTIHESQPDTGRLSIISCSQNSVTGNSAVSGLPWLIHQPIISGELIAIVPAEVGYEEAAHIINNNPTVVGAIVQRDEAVLIAGRLNRTIPIVDCADTQLAAAAQKLMVEVRPAGQRVSTVTDVWAVSHALDLQQREQPDLALLAQWVAHERAAVFAVFAVAPPRIDTSLHDSVTWNDGRTEDTFYAIDSINSMSVGAIRRHNQHDVDDLWALDITRCLVQIGLHSPTSSHARAIVTAELAATEPAVLDVTDYFSVPVTVCESEARAAATGALTTPGIAPDAVIIDIGGGTIDLIANKTELSAAGAGEMLTAAVAHVLEVPLGAADWIKRTSAQRVESPQVMLNEDGSKSFIDSLSTHSFVGKLVTPGPSGLLSFNNSFQLAEWRLTRQAFKKRIIAENIGRLIRDYNNLDLVLVGGPAIDDELLPAVSSLSNVRAVGRGNVAGLLGQRYCVAYGLTQLVN